MKRKDKLTHRIHTRITQEKYEELSGLLRQSRGMKSHSELLRNILENQKIIVESHDNSLDKVMEQLSGIRTELHRIGININQVTTRFHGENLPEKRLVNALEIQQLYQQTDQKVAELLDIIAKLSEKWLPES